MLADYPPRPHPKKIELPETKFKKPYAERVAEGNTRFLNAFTSEQAMLKSIESREKFVEQFAATVIEINRQMEVFDLDNLNPSQLAKVTMLPELFELIISKIEEFGNKEDQAVQLAEQDMKLWLESLVGLAARYQDKLDNESRAQLQAAIDVLQSYLKVETRTTVQKHRRISENVTDAKTTDQGVVEAEQLMDDHPELIAIFPNIEALINNIKDMTGRNELKSYLIQQLDRALIEAKTYLKTQSPDKKGLIPGTKSGLLGRVKN